MGVVSLIPIIDRLGVRIKLILMSFDFVETCFNIVEFNFTPVILCLKVTYKW